MTPHLYTVAVSDADPDLAAAAALLTMVESRRLASPERPFLVAPPPQTPACHLNGRRCAAFG